MCVRSCCTHLSLPSVFRRKGVRRLRYRHTSLTPALHADRNAVGLQLALLSLTNWYDFSRPALGTGNDTLKSHRTSFQGISHLIDHTGTPPPLYKGTALPYLFEVLRARGVLSLSLPCVWGN
jgi:hypothetical protein